jgi:hypothetical protein
VHTFDEFERRELVGERGLRRSADLATGEVHLLQLEEGVLAKADLLEELCAGLEHTRPSWRHKPRLR